MVRVLNFTVVLLVAYGLLVAFVFLRQETLLYLPQALSVETAAATARQRALTIWNTGSLRGYVRLPPTGASRGTIVVFHGNAGHAIDRDYYADALVPLGYRVVLAEYPGYGEKPGALGEASLVADAVETLDAARKAFPGPLIAWGESLGAGVIGAALAARPGLVDTVVMLTPWDSLAAVAGHHYPYLPVRWLLRDRYDTAANLQTFAGPTVVLIAEHDRTIPSVHGRRLFESLAGKKHLRIFVGADHNSWPAEPTESWWGEVGGWLAATD